MDVIAFEGRKQSAAPSLPEISCLSLHPNGPGMNSEVRIFCRFQRRIECRSSRIGRDNKRTPFWDSDRMWYIIILTKLKSMQSPLAVIDKSPRVKVSFPLIALISPSHPTFLLLSSSMSPRQSTISLHAKLSEELNSESPWTDEVIPHAFHDDAFHTFDSSSTTLGTFQIFPTDYPLPSFEDDHLGPPSTSSGGSERVDFTDPALNTWATPYGAQYNDLYAAFTCFASIERG